MKARISLLHEEEAEEPPLNLTPLIDVVFVLLITFMILSPLLNIEHIALAEKGPASQKEMKYTPISVELRADNAIWFRGKIVSLDFLEGALKQEKSSKGTPQLIADKRAQFGSYQDLKNLFERCGFEQMDVVLK